MVAESVVLSGEGGSLVLDVDAEYRLARCRVLVSGDETRLGSDLLKYVVTDLLVWLRLHPTGQLQGRFEHWGLSLVVVTILSDPYSCIFGTFGPDQHTLVFATTPSEGLIGRIDLSPSCLARWRDTLERIEQQLGGGPAYLPELRLQAGGRELVLAPVTADWVWCYWRWGDRRILVSRSDVMDVSERVLGWLASQPSAQAHWRSLSYHSLYLYPSRKGQSLWLMLNDPWRKEFIDAVPLTAAEVERWTEALRHLQSLVRRRQETSQRPQ